MKDTGPRPPNSRASSLGWIKEKGVGWLSSSWSLWSSGCASRLEWDSSYFPKRTPSYSFFLNCSGASHSGNLLTGLQLCLTQGLYGLWSTQCTQEHISSRVCRIWIKFQQGQVERLLRPRAYGCSGSKWKKPAVFLWRDQHFDRLFRPAFAQEVPFLPETSEEAFYLQYIGTTPQMA